MQHSRLTNQEYVTLIGHYNNVGANSLEAQLKAKNYSPQKIKEIVAKFQGTPQKVTKSLNVEFVGGHDLEFSNFSYYYGLYNKYSQNGLLPYPGSVAEQPAKVIEIFDVLDALHAETQEQQMKQMKSKGKNGKRRN